MVAEGKVVEGRKPSEWRLAMLVWGGDCGGEKVVERRVCRGGECGEEAVKERKLSGWRVKGDVRVGKDATRPNLTQIPAHSSITTETDWLDERRLELGVSVTLRGGGGRRRGSWTNLLYEDL